MTVTARCYHTLSGRTVPVAPEAVPEALAQRDTLVWVDLEEPAPSEFALLKGIPGMDEELLVSLEKGRCAGRFSWKNGLLAFGLNTVDYRDGRLHNGTLSFIVSSRFMASIGIASGDAVSGVAEHWEKSTLPENVFAYSLFLVVDGVLDGYLVVINKAWDILDVLKRRPARRSDVDAAIPDLRNTLYDLLRLLRPYQLMFHLFLRTTQGRSPFPLERTRLYYTELNRHLNAIVSETHTCIAMLEAIVNDYRMRQSDDLNMMVTRLTVITIVLSSLMLIPAVFGMSISSVLHDVTWPRGFLAVMGLMALVLAGELFVFRLLGWTKFFRRRSNRDPAGAGH